MDPSEEKNALSDPPPSYGSHIDSSPSAPSVYPQPPQGPTSAAGYPQQPPAPMAPAYPPQPYPAQSYQTQPVYAAPLPIKSERPPDNLILSLLTCLFCNAFCLGLAALICAIQSRSSAEEGRFEVAREKGTTAKKLAIVAIVVSVVVLVISIIVYTAVGVAHLG